MRKKILHFFPDNRQWGGIEVYLQSTLSALQKHGHYEVTAAVTQGGALSENLKQAGVTVYELPVHIRTPLLRTLDFRVFQKLLPVLKAEQPDLVHIHKGRIEQGLIRMAGFPMVYTYHSYGGPNNLENAPNPMLRMLYRSTTPLLRSLTPFLSGMAIVSHYEQRRLYREQFLPRHFKTHVLHNGLDTHGILLQAQHTNRAALRNELGIPKNARVICFACRLTDDKNALAALRIAQRVLTAPRLHYPVYFLVAGEGKLAKEFQEAFSNDPLLSQHGQYLGFRQDIHPLVKMSDITISTSLQEGFGLRVLESLLLGKPCVTYAAGGIPEVMSLPEAQDWLIPVGQEDRFVEHLIRTIHLTDNELQRLAPILEAHARRFDIHRHVNQLEAFYDQVFSGLKTKTRC